MLVPLMLPERLVVPAVVLPVRVHVREKLGVAGGFDDRGDVGVLARRVAVFLVRAVAVIRPGRSVR